MSCKGHRIFSKSDLEDIVLFAMHIRFRSKEEIEKMAAAAHKMHKNTAEMNTTINSLKRKLKK